MKKDKRTIIAYIGGGGVNFAWRFFSELAGEEIYAQVNLYDIDKQSSLSNEVIGNAFRENPKAKSDIIYLACDTAKDALAHADIVILSMNVGSVDEQIKELFLPEAYGIYQSIGENAGPTSVIKSLKLLPIYIEYAKLIKKYCPEAFVINLSSPMSASMQILYDTFPEIKLFGSTNELFQANELLAGLVEKEYHISGIRKRDIKSTLLGICGFCFYNEIKYNGRDILPLFKSYAEKYYETGYELRNGEYKTNPVASANKIKFDFFLRYGLVPAVSDRVIADFCPNWYLKSPSVISNWKFTQNTSNYIKKLYFERMSKVKNLMNGNDKLPVGVYTSELSLQIKALLGDGNIITNICSKNTGQVANLPLGAIVSTNALISKNSVQPIASGNLPDELYALTIRHILNQQTIVKSVKERDLDIAFNAFLNDPLMSADLDSATKLYKEMLSSASEYLEYFC